MKTELIAECARLFKVHPRDLIGRARFAFLSGPRFALYKALHMRGWALTQIGQFLNRDHSTVMYGIRRAEWMMERDPLYAEKIEQLATLTYKKLELNYEDHQAEAA